MLDGIKEYMRMIPAYDPKFFRVAEPAEPRLPASDLYHLLPFNQKEAYIFDEILARLVDGSEHMEFRPDYGPEIYTGLVKIDGMLVGAIGNRQGLLPKGYPEYADYPGIGGKLYRQGLIKMNEFVTLCGRDRVPIIWFQDTTGIDVGDVAEKAELLGLGQSLIYSIQQTERADDAGGAAQGQRGGSLRHGRPDRQPPQRLHARHCRDRNLRHARRDSGGCDLCPTRGQGKGCRQAACSRSPRR